MLFESEFLEEFKENPIHNYHIFYDKVMEAVEHYGRFEDGIWFHSFNSLRWNEEQYLTLVEAYYILVNLDLDILATLNLNQKPEFGNETEGSDCTRIRDLLTDVSTTIFNRRRELRLSAIKSKIDASMSNSIFVYEFSQGDLDKVQNLINDLRVEISASELFEDKHKQRLLKRLENLQSELHKKMSDLDRFWGLMGDAGVALGKFGNDAKPIVDRIKELTQIVWRTQSRAEELPSDTPIPVLEDNSNM